MQTDSSSLWRWLTMAAANGDPSLFFSAPTRNIRQSEGGHSELSIGSVITFSFRRPRPNSVTRVIVARVGRVRGLSLQWTVRPWPCQTHTYAHAMPHHTLISGPELSLVSSSFYLTWMDIRLCVRSGLPCVAPSFAHCSMCKRYVPLGVGVYKWPSPETKIPCPPPIPVRVLSTLRPPLRASKPYT